MISIPISRNNEKSNPRAILQEGKIKHLLPPSYHLNPIEGKQSSLVFYDYGWDFLDFIKKAGFREAYVLGFYDIFYGHLGDDLQFIFFGKK